MHDDIPEVFSLSSLEYTLPPRSRLYPLDPIGVGTSDVEQLTSYIHRLAEAHGVSLRILVEHELVPLLSTHYIRHAKKILSFFYRAAPLNGTNPTARDWVKALELLTLRRDLHLLTMLPWVDVIPITRLLRPTRSWCPLCLDEMRVRNDVVYEPLLWALEVVTVCVHHQRRLDVICSTCQKLVPILGAWGRSGYCPLCRQWLGMLSSGANCTAELLTSDELSWQEFVYRALGNVLASAPTLTTYPQSSSIVNALKICIDQVTGGNVTAFSHHIRIHEDVVRSWLRQKCLPQLNFLLWICYCLDRQPLEFWISERVEVLGQTGVQLRRPQSKRVVVTVRGEPRTRNHLQQRIQAVLDREEIPPPSVSEVARRVRVNRSILRQKFPKEWQRIAERYQAYVKAKKVERIGQLTEHVRQAVRVLMAQGAVPTRAAIARHIGVQSAFLDPEANAAYIDELRLLGQHPPKWF